VRNDLVRAGLEAPVATGVGNDSEGSATMTQQKREKERKKQEKAQRKKENKVTRKLDKDGVEEEELELLDGPVYFKDFDMSDIKI
jgi:hypothetical protein